MAENYSLGSSFGLNISSSQTKREETYNSSAQKASNDLFGAINNYVDKYENVFTGEVEKEINMYSRQAMFVGMSLRAGETKRNFDMNI